MTAQFRMDGMDEFIRKLSKLSVRSGRKVLRKGTRAASTPIQKAVRKAAPVGDTGNLQRSIGRKFKFYRPSTTDVAVIGGRVDGDHKGYLFHIAEAGTRERINPNRFGKGEGSTGRMPALRFAERASESVMQMAGAKGAEALRKALDEEIARLRSGG